MGKQCARDGRMALLDTDEVLQILRAGVERAGSQVAWAKQFGVERTIVTMVLAGKRPPSRQILKALHLEKVAAFRPARRGSSARQAIKRRDSSAGVPQLEG